MWRQIKDYSNYEINTDAVIKNIKTNRILKQSKGEYLTVGLSKNGVQKTHSVHILMGESFLIKPSKNSVINHLDGNKYNNKLSNLEYTTQGKNISHAFKTKLRSHIGSNSNRALLNETKVLEIRSSNLIPSELAIKYNVHINTIKSVLSKKNWTHV